MPKRKGSPKGQKKPQFPVEFWAQLRVSYESGKYGSTEELRNDYKKRGYKVPSIDRIRQKVTREGWEKAIHEEEIHEAIHQKYLRVAAEAGITDKYLIDKIKEMLEDKGDRNNGLQRLYDITGIRAPHKIARTDDEGNVVEDRILVLPANGFEPVKRH